MEKKMNLLKGIILTLSLVFFTPAQSQDKKAKTPTTKEAVKKSEGNQSDDKKETPPKTETATPEKQTSQGQRRQTPVRYKLP